MAEVVAIGVKGQIVIPKYMREDFRMSKGTKLLVVEEKDQIILKPIRLQDTHLAMLLSEPVLKKTWANKYDERWDDVL